MVWRWTMNMFCIKASAAACFEMKCNLLVCPTMTQSAHFAYLQVQSHFFQSLVRLSVSEITPLAVMVVVNFLIQTNFVWSLSSTQQNAAAAVKIGCVKGPDLDVHANLNDQSGAYHYDQTVIHDVQDVQVNSSISMSWRPVCSWCVEGAVHWNQLTMLPTGTPGCSVLGGKRNLFWHSLNIKVRNRYPQLHHFTGMLVESAQWSQVDEMGLAFWTFIQACCRCFTEKDPSSICSKRSIVRWRQCPHVGPATIRVSTFTRVLIGEHRETKLFSHIQYFQDPIVWTK